MKLVHRFAYYFGGFTIGLIFLFFILNKKDTSCAYFPDARVLKHIRTKERVYSQTALQDIRRFKFDTAQVSIILNNGDVDFSRSKVHRDSCNLYWVTGNGENELVEILFKNCDSVATVEKIKVKQQ